MKPSLVLATVFVAVVLVGHPTPASASFNVCNRTSHDSVAVAIGASYYIDKHYSAAVANKSAGWFVISKGNCHAVIEGNISDKTIYLYAYAVGNRSTTWSGKYNFCLDNKDAFEYGIVQARPIMGRTPPCEYGSVYGMLFIDTDDSIDFTYNLTDSSATSTAPARTANAVLSVTSGLAAQPGSANPLAGHTFVLMKQSYEAALAGGGFQPPPGMSPVMGLLTACRNRQPACEQGVAAVDSSTVSGARADANGKAQLPGLPAGTYYFYAQGDYNAQLYKWDFKVELKPGANSLTLDQRNATPVK